jgi:hypothetical protein
MPLIGAGHGGMSEVDALRHMRAGLIELEREPATVEARIVLYGPVTCPAGFLRRSAELISSGQSAIAAPVIPQPSPTP